LPSSEQEDPPSPGPLPNYVRQECRMTPLSRLYQGILFSVFPLPGSALRGHFLIYPSSHFTKKPLVSASPDGCCVNISKGGAVSFFFFFFSFIFFFLFFSLSLIPFFLLNQEQSLRVPCRSHAVPSCPMPAEVQITFYSPSESQAGVQADGLPSPAR